MKSSKIYVECKFLLFCLLIGIKLSSCRYIKNDKSENEIANQNMISSNPDEDFDLETVLDDYYDEFWQYLDVLSQKLEKNKGKEKAKNPNPRDYDYMSDMAVPEPEVDEKKFKSFLTNSMGQEKQNYTWPFGNVSIFNESSKDSGIPDAVRAYRERSKEMRLKSIIHQVLSFRGGNPRANETSPDLRHYNALREIYEKNIKRTKNDEWTSSYTEKVQSFYPSCEIPRNTDEDMWFDPLSMNLLFDLDYPTPQEDSTIIIASAKLRLYKLPQENYTLPSVDIGSARGKSDRIQNSFGLLPGDDDRQIRVSVYWYTKSLRRQRVKKKLLDSQMLSVFAPKWVEFNIRPAVRSWKESGRNFGLVVKVEDEDGTLLLADQYIHAMNCSKWSATVRPIPSIVMDGVNQYFIENLSENKNETGEETKASEEKHKIYPYQPLLYPIVDLCTREVPNSDVTSIASVDSAKKALEANFLNISRRGFNIGNDSIAMFLKKNNLDIKEISKLSRVDKSVPRKSETKNSEPRVSYFRNVPIGSPSTNQNGNIKKSRGAQDELEFRSESQKSETDEERRGERELPRIRHNRKQWDAFQKSSNSDSRLGSDYNSTDHH